jgi:hypothetical protein
MNINQDEKQLLQALGELSKLGPIEAVGKGANAVGKTLQKSLGIIHSTKSRNSLFNYIITSTTSGHNSSGRTNLFACVPDWSASNFKSSKELVETFGREDLSRGYKKSLFCTSTSEGANGFGLFLKVNSENKELQEWFESTDNNSHLVSWDIEKLKSKLSCLSKTAIVTALPINLSGKLAFHYRYVDLLEQPSVNSFLEMLKDGSITIDHCISIKEGKTSAREQGPLFKVRAQSRGELYSKAKRIDLMEL